MDAVSSDVILYRTTKPHDHAISKKIRIPEDVKEKIDELYRSGVTAPSLLLRNIRDLGLHELKIRQLNAYLSRVRKTINGK